MPWNSCLGRHSAERLFGGIRFATLTHTLTLNLTLPRIPALTPSTTENHPTLWDTLVRPKIIVFQYVLGASHFLKYSGTTESHCFFFAMFLKYAHTHTHTHKDHYNTKPQKQQYPGNDFEATQNNNQK